MWEKKRVEAANSGTELHKLIEDVYNGVRSLPESNDPAVKQFARFKRAHQHLMPYRAEWIVFDTDLELAGSIDMVFIDSEGLYHIYDWKRTPKLWISIIFRIPTTGTMHSS